MRELVAPVLDSPPLRRYGLPEYIKLDSPAAGANFVQQIDGRFHVRLISLFCRLVTSADAANRTLRVEYRDAEDNTFAVMGNPVTYPANTTEDFAFSVYQPRGEWEVAATNLVPLHPILLPPTFDFAIVVNNIDNTDQISRVRVMWERFYTGEADDVLALPS